MDLILNRLNPETDLISGRGILDMLDHASPFAGFGAKLGIDLTSPLPGEPGCPGPDPSERHPLPGRDDLTAVVQKTIPGVTDARTYPELKPGGPEQSVRNPVLLLAVERGPSKTVPDYAQSLFHEAALRGYRFFLLYDKGTDLKNHSRLLWRLFNNVDPERDLTFKNDRVVIDACRKGPEDGYKREWPEELTFDEPSS
jgi:4-hydroxy-3-polyprenylbenzoate decarboxylase